MNRRSPSKLLIAVPLPILNVQDWRVTFCLPEWMLATVLVAAFGLGWFLGGREIFKR